MIIKANAKRVLVLGGGISGLAFSWYFKKKFPHIPLTILEKSSRLGGWIRSEEHQGFLFEQGPRSCRLAGNGVHTLNLIQELQKEEDLIFADPSAHHRYLYFQNRLRQIPTTLSTLVKSPWMWKALYPILWEWRRDFGVTDETVDRFITRRLGSRFAQMFMDPLTTGIYAGDTRELSVKSCFPQLYQWEKERGSLLRGLLRSKKTSIQRTKKSSLFSLKRGMESLITAIAEKLDADIRLSQEILGLEFRPNEIEVILATGERITADHVFSAIPSHSLSKLITPHHATLGDALSSIPHATVALVSLGFKNAILKKKGFGYLIPSSEREPILGCVWDSCVFPEQNQHQQETRLTVMMGGVYQPEVSSWDSDTCIRTAIHALSRHLGVVLEPSIMNCYFARESIPQYLVGHSEKISYLEKELHSLSPNFSAFGSSFYGVSVNDCIANAKALVSSILEK